MAQKQAKFRIRFQMSVNLPFAHPVVMNERMWKYFAARRRRNNVLMCSQIDLSSIKLNLGKNHRNLDGRYFSICIFSGTEEERVLILSCMIRKSVCEIESESVCA